MTLTATPAADSNFAGWNGACYGMGTCTLTMNGNRSVTATFQPVGLTYTLSVSRSGSGSGTVTSSPSGINCGSECSAAYLSGTLVTLTASAAGNSTFTGWSGACFGMGTCTVTMNAARSVTATFESNTPPTVVIYDDALGSGWDNWSWNATIDLEATSPIQAGTHAVNATLSGWGAFSPAMPSGSIDTFGYAALQFWVHGGTGSNKALSVYTEGDHGESTHFVITAVVNTWAEITVTLSARGDPASIHRLNFFNNRTSALSMITFDEIRLVPAATPSEPKGLRIRRREAPLR